MEPILKVSDINVYYGAIHAIKGVSFEVNPGEVVTLIGANGAGKSTTLQTVSGLLHSRTGSIEFLGENLMGVPAHKVVAKGLAQVPEGRRVFLQMTVEENLEMGAYTRSGGDIDADLEKVYAYFPRLMERRRQIAGTLSGGEQQMLAMGRALMSRPKLLMLDEPSMGLAPILVEQIFKIIQTLHEAGTTILLVEQNAQAALSIADRGYVLETGKIVTSGTGTELLASPEIKKAYLGSEKGERVLSFFLCNLPGMWYTAVMTERRDPMRAEERRQAIRELLQRAKQPVSATALAAQFSVSRQIIVGDIALLRAAGADISATPRGYVILRETGGLVRQVAVQHDAAGMGEELNAMVDQGCTVLDVIVDHPIYGQLTGPLQLSNRYDVGQFLSRCAQSDARPLSELTEGIHLHTLSCPDEAAFGRVCRELRRLGVLLEG